MLIRKSKYDAVVLERDAARASRDDAIALAEKLHGDLQAARDARLICLTAIPLPQPRDPAGKFARRVA